MAKLSYSIKPDRNFLTSIYCTDLQQIRDVLELHAGIDGRLRQLLPRRSQRL